MLSYVTTLTVLLSIPFMFYCEDIEIITSFGRLKGRKESLSKGGDVYQFLKIPYAMPPIGDLRFQKPRPHTTLSGLYDATELGPSCMQSITEGGEMFLSNLNVSEDCLHLNIYVPHDISTVPRAVMIWIHGGGWYVGQGTMYDGSILAATGDVIVVTINYRLGFFGFMSTLDDQYPGNYGLFDALEAIKWTKKHIASFGGDPNKITLFGESAGAFNVLYLATSPLSKGLFQRVLMESGGDLRAEALDPEIKNTTFRVMVDFGCVNDSDGYSINADTVQCLRDVGADTILKSMMSLGAYRNEHLPTFKDAFRPCIDGELITDVPENLLRDLSSDSSNIFYSLDILDGTNNGEGGMMFQFVETLQNTSNFNIKDGIPRNVLCDILIPKIVALYYDSNTEISRAMCGAYTNFGGIGDQGRAAIEWFGDLIMTYPAQLLLETHSRSSSKNTYQYLFSKSPFYRWYPPFPSWFIGANHADELPCVFGLRRFVKSYSQSDEKLCNHVMAYWTNFAKTGNPNSDGLPFWPSYRIRNAYMELNDQVTAKHDLYRDRLVLWDKTIPFILSKQKEAVQPIG